MKQRCEGRTSAPWPFIVEGVKTQGARRARYGARSSRIETRVHPSALCACLFWVSDRLYVGLTGTLAEPKMWPHFFRTSGLEEVRDETIFSADPDANLDVPAQGQVHCFHVDRCNRSDVRSTGRKSSVLHVLRRKLG